MDENLQSKSETVRRFTTKGGTTVEFDNEEAEETITVCTPNQSLLMIQETKGLMVIQAGETSISLDSINGKIVIKAEKGIDLITDKACYSMKSDGDFLIKGNDMAVKNQSMELETEKKIDVKIGTDGCQIELDGDIHVEGNDIVIKNQNLELKTEKKIDIKIGTDGCQMKSDGGIRIEGYDVALKGQAIELESKEKLTLNGTNSTLSGTAETHIKAGGMLLLNGAITKIN